MSLLKTFGVGNQQMMFSELLDHITKDAVDDLFEWLGLETSDRQGEIVDHKEGIWRKERKDGKPHRAMFSERKIRRIARIVRGPGSALGY